MKKYFNFVAIAAASLVIFFLSGCGSHFVNRADTDLIFYQRIGASSPLIPATINNKVNASFFVAPNIDEFLLSADIAYRLGLDWKKGDITLAYLPDKTLVPARKVVLRNVRFKGKGFNKVKAKVVEGLYSFGCDGIIGLNYNNYKLALKRNKDNDLVLKRKWIFWEF